MLSPLVCSWNASPRFSLNSIVTRNNTILLIVPQGYPDLSSLGSVVPFHFCEKRGFSWQTDCDAPHCPALRHYTTQLVLLYRLFTMISVFAASRRPPLPLH